MTSAGKKPPVSCVISEDMFPAHVIYIVGLENTPADENQNPILVLICGYVRNLLTTDSEVSREGYSIPQKKKTAFSFWFSRTHGV